LKKQEKHIFAMENTVSIVYFNKCPANSRQNFITRFPHSIKIVGKYLMLFKCIYAEIKYQVTL